MPSHNVSFSCALLVTTTTTTISTKEYNSSLARKENSIYSTDTHSARRAPDFPTRAFSFFFATLSFHSRLAFSRGGFLFASYIYTPDAQCVYFFLSTSHINTRARDCVSPTFWIREIEWDSFSLLYIYIVANAFIDFTPHP